MRYSHLALGDFDFGQYQLHKIISTITTTAESARKDAAQEEKKKKRLFPGFQRACVGLQPAVKCCPFTPKSSCQQLTERYKTELLIIHS